MRNLYRLILLLMLLPGIALSLAASDSSSNLSEEAQQDKEKTKLGGYKILPVPVFITEPAIGEGLGVALALFHPVKAGTIPKATTPTSIGQMGKDHQEPPPVITGVFAGRTNNGTWAYGIGHMNNWREDHVRYSGALARANVQSTLYVGNLPIDFTLEGNLLFQEIKFRIADSGFFLGLSLSYLDAIFDVNSLGSANLTGTLAISDITDVGLAAVTSYDTRDNTMNPNRGQLVDLSIWRYDEAMGGGFNYWSSKLNALSFHHFDERFTLGFRLDVAAVEGDAPFYGYPWVSLRGIPAMRYQDERAGAVEVEGRYQFAPKWEVLGFAGWGFTGGDSPIYDNPDDIYNYGIGARYKIFEEQNVWVGFDVAQGPEEMNWYLQVGHAW